MPSFWNERQDIAILALSVLYIGAIIGAMFGWGAADGWDAPKPVDHPNPERFWPKPGTTGTNRTNNCSDFNELYQSPVRYAKVDCYSKWYYWQLPEEEATEVTRLVVWLLYALHQILHWVFIWFAQDFKRQHGAEEKKEELYTGRLRWFNWALVATTFLFHIFHLVQSHTTYDATAKDVVIQSSQGSVIMMTIFIILIEYRDRGMFLGWPSRHSTDRVAAKVRLAWEPFTYVRKYHGYAFSWAVIYTFWYHPMENTFGHAMGFTHTFLVMIQGSLIYQKIHLNKYLRLLLESWVWFHGFSVAIMVSTGDWWKEAEPFIFGFGFGTMFFVTQLYGLPFWRHISPWWRFIPAVGWIVATVLTVTVTDDISNGTLSTLVMIPSGQWACAFAAWLIIYALQWCMPRRIASFGPIFQGAMTCFFYSIFIVVSFLFQKYAASVDINFMAMTYILVFIFMIGCMLSWFCLPVPDIEQPKRISTNSTNTVKEVKL